MPLASFTVPFVAEDEDLLLLQFPSIASELGRYRRLVAAVATHKSVMEALRLVLLLKGAS